MSEQTVETLPADEIADDHELLISVAARLNRTSAVLLSSLDVPLTFRQYRTLARVIGGYTSLRQLAARGNLSLPAVSENVDGLVKRGLMETTQSTADRRAIVLHVTDAGRAAADAARAAIDDLVGFLLTGVDSARRAELQEALQEIYAAATVYFTNNLIGRPER